LPAGVACNAFGNAVAGMRADFRDIDNDGRPDIFGTAMFGKGSPTYKNLGDGLFQDVTAATGLAALTSRSTAWGAGVFDFDND
jgi:enediyne biosynthesis protein E4